MMGRFGIVVTLVLLGVSLMSCSFAGSASTSNPSFLGIPPHDVNYYKVSLDSDTILCKDGSAHFSLPQLNDGFCDCPDGTDEPGTSACPTARFYCRNAGHSPLLLFSSRVNDGICDCCDGSDEYDGLVKCPNTCWQAGKAARDKLKKKIAVFKEGLALRNKDIQHAQLAIAKDESELAKLRNDEAVLKGLVKQLKERKEQIEKAEEKELLQREKEEKERQEAEEKANKEKIELEVETKQGERQTDDKTHNDGNPKESMHVADIGVLDNSSPDVGMSDEEVEHSYASEDKRSPVNEVEQHVPAEEKPTPSKSEDESAAAAGTSHDGGSKESADKLENGPSENTEGLSKEELGRLVASRWTGNEKQTEESVAKDSGHEDNEDHEEIPPDTNDEEYDGYASETDDDSGKYDNIEDDIDETYEEDIHDETKHDSDDELGLSDSTSPTSPSWLEKIQQTVRSILQTVNLFQTPVDKSEAARIRKEYEESNNKLSKIESRISSLTQKLKHDFGTHKEFYSFYDHCYESKQNKYVYKVCPFKQASQVEGHSTTRLGRWDKFEDSYQVMLFSSGDKCWNGPDRSLKVKLRCGLKNEVMDVDEPSRCEYVALMSTPAVCVEEKLKELEDKLELMNREAPQSHDEL